MTVPDFLTCASCKYALRGLTPDSACPECGHAVADSLKQHQDHGLYLRREHFVFSSLLAMACLTAVRELVIFTTFQFGLAYLFLFALGIVFLCELALFFCLLPMTFNSGGLSPTQTENLRPAKIAFFITYSSPAWAWCLACVSPTLGVALLICLFSITRTILWVTALNRTARLAKTTGSTVTHTILIFMQGYTILLALIGSGMILAAAARQKPAYTPYYSQFAWVPSAMIFPFIGSLAIILAICLRNLKESPGVTSPPPPK